MTTAFLVGLALGFTGGFVIACLMAATRVTELREALVVARDDAEYLRGIVRQYDYDAGKIYLSEFDADLMREMGIGR